MWVSFLTRTGWFHDVFLDLYRELVNVCIGNVLLGSKRSFTRELCLLMTTYTQGEGDLLFVTKR